MGADAMRSALIGMGLLATACDVPILHPNEEGATGLVVAATDEVQAANIGIVDSSGFVRSSSVISTASTKADFSTALGGDLAFPSTVTDSTDLVILDRYPGSVITWLDVSTPKPTVRAQLSVATGFAANLHDYIPYSADKVFVTRFDSNSSPGQEPFDSGGDLLVIDLIDPKTPQIVRRVDIASALPAGNQYFAHPDRARLLPDGKIYVVVPYYDVNHHSGASYLAVVDPETERVESYALLKGVSGCSGIDAAPDARSLAIACSGSWQGTGRADASTSAIVGVSIAPLRELWRMGVGTDRRSFGFTATFADSHHVIATRLGDLGPPILNDTVELIDIDAGTSATLIESAGQPASLSVGPCATQVGLCFLADASRNQIVRLDLNASGDYAITKFNWHDPVGLRPRLLTFVGPDPAG
jgi:hypothetical protein